MGFGKIFGFIKAKRKYISDLLEDFRRKNGVVEKMAVATMDGFIIYEHGIEENYLHKVLLVVMPWIKKCLNDERSICRLIGIEKMGNYLICWGYDYDIVTLFWFKDNDKREIVKRLVCKLLDTIGDTI